MFSARPISTTAIRRILEMEERIVELETRLAFQEDAIHHLNQTVSDQQRQIDVLKEILETLKLRLRSLSLSPVASGDPEPPPPHY